MIPDGSSPQEAETGTARKSMRERCLARGKRVPAQNRPQSDGRSLRMTVPPKAQRGSIASRGAMPGAGSEDPEGREHQERIGEPRLQRTSVGHKTLKSTQVGGITRLRQG